jgi:hypothetical protein
MSDDGERVGRMKGCVCVRVTWFTGVGCVGIFVGVGGVEGHGIWRNVTCVTLQN